MLKAVFLPPGDGLPQPIWLQRLTAVARWANRFLNFKGEWVVQK